MHFDFLCLYIYKYICIYVCMFHDVFPNAVEFQVAVKHRSKSPQVTAEESALAVSENGWKSGRFRFTMKGDHHKNTKILEDFRTTALLISKIGNTNHHDFSIFFNSVLSCIFIRALFPEGGGTRRLPWNSHGGKTNSKFRRNMEKIQYEIMSCAWHHW